ncbi:ABC transporter permease subunit [Georgenia satyanarayanai]|uniref:ABC transporter permease n=1 Tax=Georgenia satyanarayanai TaxID=860221 RepID=UPI00203BC03F|nr:ABC transporter permease subunit [Georgenia satyanarayanai]MCM3662222.1 ABC transporter permease subunit [Georgenia satyanarayanai]
MSLFADAWAWLTAREQWTGTTVLDRAGEHLLYTLLALAVSAAIAIPLGYLVGHTGRGRQLTVALAGAGRALPSLGLLTVLTLLVGVGDAVLAATVVFVVLAVPSVLAGTYAGVENVDGAVTESARAMGMTPWQVLTRVEAPLGLPLLVGGLRSAALQVVATAVLAAYVGLGGLGIYVQRGISLRRYDEMLGGAIAIVALAVVVDAVFAVLARLAVRVAGGQGRLGTSTEGHR